jgi:hypothetical protein
LPNRVSQNLARLCHCFAYFGIPRFAKLIQHVFYPFDLIV